MSIDIYIFIQAKESLVRRQRKMNGEQIVYAIHRNGRMARGFKGIYLNNEICSDLKQGEYCIYNTVYKVGEMGHWVGYFRKGSFIYFIDSLGSEAHKYGGQINKFYSRYKQSIKTLLKRNVQSSISNMCGGYVLYFIFHLMRDRKIKDVLDSFSFNKLSYNDKMIEVFMNKLNNSVKNCIHMSCFYEMYQKKCQSENNCFCLHCIK